MRIEKAIKLLEETGLDCMDEEATQEALWMAIDALKEKEKLIHCKDCAMYEEGKRSDGHWCRGRKVKRNGYCDLAERKQPKPNNL